MNYVNPPDVVAKMVALGEQKAALAAGHLIIRGMLSGAILGIATTVAITATIQSNVPLVGALVFPAGLVMIVLLGLDLLTGSFALVPVAVLAGRASPRAMGAHFLWVMVGNLIGAVLFGMMLIATMHGPASAAVADRLIMAAQAKTIGYAALGWAGMASVFVKGVLCNWMVTLGVVLGLSSTATAGKILAVWLPIFMFFTLGFEHAIVNFFVIPTGMLLGAKVSLADWLTWNALPVIIGNFVGGFLFTGLALYLTHPPQPQATRHPDDTTAPAAAPAAEQRCIAIEPSGTVT